MASAPRDRLVVATGNRGKLEELRALLAGLDVDVCGVAEVLPDPPRVVEDGVTFAENATKKARAVAAATGSLTLADDSGLVVDVLGGRPGVRSARFAHPHATDAENNAALLAALAPLDDEAPVAATPAAGRSTVPLHSPFTARFVCVLALVDPTSAGEAPRLVEGVCEGWITQSPRGDAGFGYDPLFVVEGTNRTMAELALDEKNRVSHRARALAKLRPVLEGVLRCRVATAG